jgi:hypothetical protein
VLSFPYPLRFLFASQPVVMGQVLGIVYRCIATHLIKQAGFSHKSARTTGAVTLIQRFGSALNLNIHFHMLFLDGVYVERPDGSLRFRWVKAPTNAELTQLTHTLAIRVGHFLERQGLLERDAENSSYIRPVQYKRRYEVAKRGLPRYKKYGFHVDMLIYYFKASALTTDIGNSF